VPAGNPLSQAILAVGDSVMLGAEQSLHDTIPGIFVDAKVSRQFWDATVVLQAYKDEGLLTRGASMAEYWRDALHSLKGLPNVVDIRNVGLMGAVEVAPRKEGVGARGYDVMVDCFNNGLYLRMSGDSFAMSPPLIVEKSHIDDIVSILGDAIKRVA